ncbi:MAG: hypothetical protein COT00_03885 [Candidatus Omnitrophica bacterium CG07_land_8_20_14_0_80_50_8]|nr:MAG: hypothetical protein COT00_03885 [Candidatus Omnitrophica bacterium CG07_land_8_20_14_0_80_50_8]
MNLLKGSWVLKAASLICAVLTYTYIAGEINNVEKDKKLADPSYKLIKLTARNLPVKVRLATSPPDGYRLLADKVSPEPARVTVVGPEALLEETSVAETALIDISESTKSITKKIPLESVAGIPLSGTPYLVDVTVPIEKIVEEKVPTKENR